MTTVMKLNGLNLNFTLKSIERHFLRELRDRQLAVKMMDESAIEVVKDYTRRHAEVRITHALDAIKATGVMRAMGKGGRPGWRNKRDALRLRDKKFNFTDSSQQVHE